MMVPGKTITTFLLASTMLIASCQRSGPGDAEVDACIQGMEAAVKSDAPIAERSANMAASCAQVYTEKECQEAHKKFGEGDPSQKARLLAERCAHAYCDKLDKAKLSLCSDIPVTSPMELAKGWGELREAIWKRDLGEERAKRLDEATRRIAEERRKAMQ